MTKYNRLFRDFNEYREEHSLCNELPYWEFTDDMAALSDGTLCRAYRLSGLAIETWDAEQVNRMTQDLRSLLNGLPDGLELSFVTVKNSDCQDQIMAHESLRAERAEIQWISDARVGVLKRESLSKLTLYLFVYRRFESSTVTGGLGVIASLFKAPRSFQSIRRTEFDTMALDLSQSSQAIEDSLRSIGVSANRLNSKEIWDLIYQFLNPARAADISAPAPTQTHTAQEFQPAEIKIVPELALASPREQLVFSDVIQGVEAFFCDGHYHRLITLKTLPETTHSALVSKILALQFHFWLDVHVKVPEQSKELSDLQAKRRMAHSMALSHGGRATDLESEARLNSTEELLRELINTGQKIFYFQMAILLRSKSQDELDRMTKGTLNKFRELNGAEGLAETVAGFKVFKTILPLGNVASIRAKRVKTDNLADFLPVYEPYCGKGVAPVCLFRNRQGGLVSYDPFDQRLPNYNGLVTGSSGAGKSFINNLILLQFMSQNPVTFVIDIGGSYRKLCQFMGGQYIEITPPKEGESRLALNPFALEEGQIEPSSQKIKFLLALLENMFTETEEDRLPKLDKSLLEEAVIDTYKKMQSRGGPLLSDLRDELAHSKEESLRNFAKMLYPWTGDRAYGRLLDRKNELQLNSDFVVFDLKGLSNYPDLQAVMILIITDYIVGKTESNQFQGRRKRILMDEVWQLLKNRASANAMEYWVRTLRKTGSGITFITQGLDEIAAHPIASAILGNTATKLILMQKGDIEITKRILKLNEQEMALVSSLRQKKGEYSEAFLFAGDDRTVIRACPTSLEYWLATSDRDDNDALEKFQQENPALTLPETIYELAKKYPRGVAFS